LQTPLNASASTAGILFSKTIFEVPEFQREYSWGLEEVSDFWVDLQQNLDSDSYFLGLLILTDSSESDRDSRKAVVDGQQRIITLSLLATAIYHEAVLRDRKALAERIQAEFLSSIDYDTDETAPRVRLSDKADDLTFQALLANGEAPAVEDSDSVSARMVASYQLIERRLQQDLLPDPFKRLGRWTDFITNRLYFAVFVHPDSSSAYQVYEVVNTRGKELTTAHLLKNYLISRAIPEARSDIYRDWTNLSRQFAVEGNNNFVQYIRHVITVRSGYVLPRDLFDYLSGRRRVAGDRLPPDPKQLLAYLSEDLALYLQMVDPNLGGPAEPEALRIFAALNELGVLTVRPILLAMSNVPDALAGMEYVLQLVVRRIVVGNLGTGNVERRFGEAARKIHQLGNWQTIVEDLSDLNPSKEEFVEQLRKRQFNKQVLQFLRQSLVQRTKTPSDQGTLHFIWSRQLQFDEMDESEGALIVSTIGNTFLSDLKRRPRAVVDWESFKRDVLPTAAVGEWADRLSRLPKWDRPAAEALGGELARAAGDIWY
jgi:hypothetical protein